MLEVSRDTRETSIITHKYVLQWVKFIEELMSGDQKNLTRLNKEGNQWLIYLQGN